MGSQKQDQVQVARGARDLWAAIYEVFLEIFMSDAYVPGYRSVYSVLPLRLFHSNLHELG
jgi:hypothetical protein